VLSSARAQVTARTRYTENRLAEAVRRGVDQYVLRGAGLDSFAYQSPLAGQVHTFEVDHPATQQWKMSMLSGTAARGAVTFFPIDFETHALLDCLIGTQRESVDVALWNRADSLRPIRLSVLAHGTVSPIRS
jgi:methyltransferase (TIGR00027 family)